MKALFLAAAGWGLLAACAAPPCTPDPVTPSDGATAEICGTR